MARTRIQQHALPTRVGEEKHIADEYHGAVGGPYNNRVQAEPTKSIVRSHQIVFGFSRFNCFCVIFCFVLLFNEPDELSFLFMSSVDNFR